MWTTMTCILQATKSTKISICHDFLVFNSYRTSGEIEDRRAQQVGYQPKGMMDFTPICWAIHLGVVRGQLRIEEDHLWISEGG